MFFILLSITFFVLRTLPIFEITEYDFITVYTGKNLTEQTPLSNHQQGEITSSFDTIEWICMKEYFLEQMFEAFFYI